MCPYVTKLFLPAHVSFILSPLDGELPLAFNTQRHGACQANASLDLALIAVFKKAGVALRREKPRAGDAFRTKGPSGPLHLHPRQLFRAASCKAGAVASPLRSSHRCALRGTSKVSTTPGLWCVRPCVRLLVVHSVVLTWSSAASDAQRPSAAPMC